MKRLLFFGVGRLQDMIEKGNVWYVRAYELGFDEVTFAYPIGQSESQQQGRTSLVSLGTGRARDFFFAPWRLYKLASDRRPDVYVTADQWYSWWTGSFLRILLRAKIVLLPVSIPHQLYVDRKITVTGWPKWLDDILQWLSFKTATAVWTSPAFGNFVEWLSSDPRSRNKLVVTRTLVEAQPTEAFLEQARLVSRDPDRHPHEQFRLIFVGRLHPEKLVDHLINMMAMLPRGEFELIIVGDGQERQRLEELAADLRVSEFIQFHGYITNELLVPILLEADAFISTLTGSSLREAALLGLPVIAYDRDWVHGLLEHDRTALLCPSNNIDQLAKQALRLRNDPNLARTLSQNSQQLAIELWTPRDVRLSLQELTDSICLDDATKPR